MTVEHWTTRLPKLALFSLFLLAAFSPRVHATPITYTMIIEHVSGQLGSLTIDPLNHCLRFTFQGDRQDVTSWAFVATYLTSGYQIRSGTASVEVLDHSSSTVLGLATFAPEDGIFVSIDNLNQRHVDVPRNCFRISSTCLWLPGLATSFHQSVWGGSTT